MPDTDDQVDVLLTLAGSGESISARVSKDEGAAIVDVWRSGVVGSKAHRQLPPRSTEKRSLARYVDLRQVAAIELRTTEPYRAGQVHGW